MIHLLIAEDEPPLLRGICKTIQSLDDRFQVVQACYNGQQAIEYLTAFPNSVDAVITDICMPGKGGLELLEFIRSKEFPIEVVLLTGYQEFKYAQQALKYQAFDYILKPVNKVQLADVLDRLYSILSKRKQNSFHQHLTNILYFDGDVQQGELPVGAFFQNEDGAYRLLYFCFGSFPTSIHHTEKNVADIFESVTAYLQAHGSSNNQYWLLRRNSNCERLLLGYFSSSCKSMQFIRTLYDSLDLCSRGISVAVGAPFVDLKQLRQEYQKLIRIVPQLFIFAQTGLFFTPSDTVGVEKEYHVPSHLKNKLIYALEENQFSDFSVSVETILEQIRQSQCTQLTLERVLKRIGFLICQKQASGTASVSEIEQMIDDLITNCSDYNCLCTEFLDKIQQLFWISRNRSEKDTLVQEITGYIENHLSENLSTHLLSNHFNIGASYLAKIFKEQNGRSPTEFIIHLRMEKARELLLTEPQMKTKDVAKIVGYSDALYFSRLFKKETGVSPSEYRETTSNTN